MYFVKEFNKTLSCISVQDYLEEMAKFWFKHGKTTEQVEPYHFHVAQVFANGIAITVVNPDTELVYVVYLTAQSATDDLGDYYSRLYSTEIIGPLTDDQKWVISQDIRVTCSRIFWPEMRIVKGGDDEH